jgi:hypothetical protein
MVEVFMEGYGFSKGRQFKGIGETKAQALKDALAAVAIANRIIKIVREEYNVCL